MKFPPNDNTMVQVKTNRSKKRSRRRWSHFSESQLVLATLNTASCKAVNRTETRTTKRSEITESTDKQHAAPAPVVTPSPVIMRGENKHVTESQTIKDAPKQLFRCVKQTRKPTDACKDSDGNKTLKKRTNPRRLFRDKKSGAAVVTTINRIQRRKRSKSKELENTVDKLADKTKRRKESSKSKETETEAVDKPVDKLQHKGGSQSKKPLKTAGKQIGKTQRRRGNNYKSDVSDPPSISKTSGVSPMPLKSRMATRERRTKGKDKTRDRHVNSWDSLASVCSVTTNRSVAENTVASEGATEPIPKTVTQDVDDNSVAYSVLSHPASVRQCSEDSQRSPSEKSQVSTIPPALLSVLAPKGLPRKLRTSAQILEETEPLRPALGRSCKDKRKEVSYNEDSDDEEGFLKNPWNFPESQSDSLCDNDFAVDSNAAHSLDSPNDTNMSPGTTGVMNYITSQSLSQSEEAPIRDRLESKISRRNTDDTKDASRRRTKQSRKDYRASMALQNAMESDSNGAGEQRSNRRSRCPPIKFSSYVVGDKDLDSVLLEGINDNRDARHNSHKRNATRDYEVVNRKLQQIDPSPKKKSISEVGKTISTSATLQQEPVENLDSQSHSVTTKSVVQVVTKGSKKKKHSKKKKSRKKKSKVRWAPLPTATTTFSVKIRVKTSMDNGRSSSSNVQVPAFDESTVQAIADQVTQACLMQARNSPGALVPNNAVVKTAPHRSKSKRVLPLSTRNSVEDANNLDDDSSEEKKPRNKPFEIDVDCNNSVVSDLTRERGVRESSARKRKLRDEEVEDEDENDFDGPMDEPEDNDSVLKDAAVEPNARFEASPAQEQLPSIPTRPTDFVTKSERSKKRRRRIWSSGDSLAGSFVSTSRSSLKKPSSRGGSTPEMTPAVTKPVSPARIARKGKDPNVGAGTNTPVVAAKAGPAHQAKELPIQKQKDETIVTADASASAKCGKCSGCTRSFDCMNCDACLARLQAGDTIFQDEAKSDCMRRVCHRVLARSDEASMGTASQPPSFPVTNILEQDDMSYISEVEWGTEKRKSKQGKPLSRASRLWSQQYERQPPQQRATGSISSVTTLTGMSGLAVKARNGRRRKGSKKNPLHYLEMPVATDGSVASWMESRRVRQALMNYDEADQDWV
ncbi:unnamed protein product [Cylindrotheca closterium]|uniref:CXXC-type domain-containing protein n=1 Tax=Cylindrotheca closterium TaxID=2856 RepID=A0AAD2PVS8_9STRA|nr:unnamed protein product [Cylindrotheca closterium]